VVEWLGEGASVMLARAAHLVSAMVLIGGVALLALAISPVLAQEREAARRMTLFAGIEARFGGLARVALLATFLSGLWLLLGLGAADRLGSAGHPALHVAIFCWGMLAILLFVVQPLLLQPARRDAGRDLGRDVRILAQCQRLHVLLLGLALVGAMAGLLEAHSHDAPDRDASGGQGQGADQSPPMR
jgi:uncharacterized membrane protein